MHPPSARPLPPVEDIATNIYRMQQHVQQRWFDRNSSHIRSNNLRFPYAVIPRSNNKKSLLHQSTNKQSPISTVSSLYINDQLTSPYFLNYGYKIKHDYLTGTIRNFDPIKKFYVFQPRYAPEIPLILPLEALEPCDKYDTYHLEGSVSNLSFENRVDFHVHRKTTDLEKEIRKAV